MLGSYLSLVCKFSLQLFSLSYFKNFSLIVRSPNRYRKRPVLSNIFSLALECWHLALTVLSLVMRLAKFLVTAGLYVGRIDRPILQKDLMVGKLRSPTSRLKL